MKTKQLTIDAMLCAMCAVLGYLSLDLGSIKISFESLPILLGGLLFGPLDGFLVGTVGTFIYQLLKYGITVTTPLWILPYAVAGLLSGGVAAKKGFKLSRRQCLTLIIVTELVITAFNTLALVVDSKVFGYFTPAFIYGALGVRLFFCIVKGAVFGLILPSLVTSVKRIR